MLAIVFGNATKPSRFAHFWRGAQSLAPATQRQKWSEPLVFCRYWLGNVLRATTACTFSTSQLPKVVRQWCFVHFDLERCFAPQRRALFRHLNFQNWSDTEVFCTFSLRNVLRATTTCTVSTSQLSKVLRYPGVLHLFTWKCASRHNGVQFFISHLASWLSTRRFSEPTFRPSEPQTTGKTRWIGLSYLFAHLHLLSSDSFSSTLLSSNLSLLSASALLCFSSVHIVGSLTSKLPSIIRLPSINGCYLNYHYNQYPSNRLTMVITPPKAVEIFPFQAPPRLAGPSTLRETQAIALGQGTHLWGDLGRPSRHGGMLLGNHWGYPLVMST